MIPKSMHAAVVTAFGKPLELQECAVHLPGPGQILVKTEACGVCHTDLHAAKGDWPLKPTPPFIPGHEAIGIVVALGAGVTIVKEGDRVGVPWLYSACGHCEYCLSAWETVCAEAKFGGYTQNGGFAEYVLADPNYVAHIPKELSPTEAAPLICAGITTYKGIKETEARPGEWIAISGCGGLGHLAIQYAKVMGLHVCAVDIDDGKLAHATRLGADMVINARTQNPGEVLKKAIGGGAHGVLITAPVRSSACRRASSRPRCSTSSRIASRSAVRSSAPGKTWPSAYNLRPKARSRQISNCSRSHQSTRSSSGSNMATCRLAWCSILPTQKATKPPMRARRRSQPSLSPPDRDHPSRPQCAPG
jgi:D-arabinose 1-dehydrogenase-like Zn-dependent alcohol dehydrogenase